MLIRDDGVVIRVPVDTISVISRNTQGVRLMKIDEGHRVASVALAPHNDDEPQKGGGKSPTAKSQMQMTMQTPAKQHPPIRRKIPIHRKTSDNRSR